MKAVVFFISFISILTVSAQNRNHYGYDTITLTADRAYSGDKAKVFLEIKYATPSGASRQKFRYPLIVAEGLDVSTLLGPESNYKRDLSKFLNKVSTEGSKGLDTLLVRGVSGKYPKYDIIYVSWEDSFTYLQSNAYALQKVIKWVNARKDDPMVRNVVWGNSMGGVIARYALADMEKRKKDHKTRLFISYDAPQKGANVPLGFQFLARHLHRVFIKAGQGLSSVRTLIPAVPRIAPLNEKYLSLSDAPATRQMLMLYADQALNVDNSEHDKFYKELESAGRKKSGGYPQECRNIALSNGSNSTQKVSMKPMEPGERLFTAYLKGRTGVLTDIVLGIPKVSLVVMKVMIAGASLLSFSPLSKLIPPGLLLVAGIPLPGSSSFTVDFRANALKSGAAHSLYLGRVWYTKKIFWFIPIDVDVIPRLERSPYISRTTPNLDTDGGGYFSNLSLKAHTEKSGGIGGIYEWYYTLSFRDKFNFIPTWSGAPYWFDNKLTAPKGTNEQHLYMDAGKANWLAEELETEGCENIEVSGSFACNDDSIVLTFPCNRPVTWEVDPSRAVDIVGKTNNTLILRKSGSEKRSEYEKRIKVTSKANQYSRKEASVSFDFVPPASVSFDDTSLKDAIERGDEIDRDDYPGLTLKHGDRAAIRVVGKVTSWGDAHVLSGIKELRDQIDNYYRTSSTLDISSFWSSIYGRDFNRWIGDAFRRYNPPNRGYKLGELEHDTVFEDGDDVLGTDPESPSMKKANYYFDTGDNLEIGITPEEEPARPDPPYRDEDGRPLVYALVPINRVASVDPVGTWTYMSDVNDNPRKTPMIMLRDSGVVVVKVSTVNRCGRDSATNYYLTPVAEKATAGSQSSQADLQVSVSPDPANDFVTVRVDAIYPPESFTLTIMSLSFPYSIMYEVSSGNPTHDDDPRTPSYSSLPMEEEERASHWPSRTPSWTCDRRVNVSTYPRGIYIAKLLITTATVTLSDDGNINDENVRSGSVRFVVTH